MESTLSSFTLAKHLTWCDRISWRASSSNFLYTNKSHKAAVSWQINNNICDIGLTYLLLGTIHGSLLWNIFVSILITYTKICDIVNSRRSAGSFQNLQEAPAMVKHLWFYLYRQPFKLRTECFYLVAPQEAEAFRTTSLLAEDIGCVNTMISHWEKNW